MKKPNNMSPLLIVGILVTTALADVSHVLSGAAHPPATPVDINSLAGPRNAFQSGNPNDFWWMASNSPLKASYDYYKKCSLKGDCLPPLSVVPGVKIAEAHYDPIDLKKNPFLNGEIQAGGASFSSSFSSSSSSSSGCTTCGGGSKSGDVPAFHSGAKIDISNNPFLTGKFATAGNGEKIKNENGFIGVQPKKPAFATSHPLSNKKPFPNAPPNAPQSFVLGGDVPATECKGKGYLCVPKAFCVNGVVNRTEELQQIRDEVQFCNVVNEVCCRLGSTSSSIVLPNGSAKSNLASNINGLVDDITAGKSSVIGSSFKFSGGAGSSPGQIQILIDQSDDIKPQVYHNGESGSQPSTNKATRDVTPSGTAVFPSTVDYSGVQISNDIRFASTIRGPAYLPPIGPTPPSTTTDYGVPSQPPTIVTYQPPIPTSTQTTYQCPPGTFLTPSGICETPSTPTPPCPFGTFRTPDGNCERPVPTTPISCPPGTTLTAFGSCETISTPTPPCPVGTVRTPSGHCGRQFVPTTPRTCPPGSILTVDGSCVRQTPTPSPRPCPPGTFLTSSGLCEGPAVSTPPPRCPFGTILTADGTCGRISTPTIPPPPSPRPCPAGTFLTASGICQPPNPPTPSCPFGTIQRPDGTCTLPGTPTTPLPCPPGTILTGSGLCESISTPTPRPPCPPGTIQSPSGICEAILTTVRPQCLPGTYLSVSGICEPLLPPSTPKPPPHAFETTSRDYLPPVTPQPSSSTGYYYETPTPTFGYPSSTLIPNSNNVNNQYVRIPTTPSYLPPPDTTGSSILDEHRPSERPDNTGEQDVINPNRVRVPTTAPPQRIPPPDQNNEPPVGCAAALKCVQEIYCTAEGVVSPVPVVLTKDQELLRVPTTVCRDEDTGIIGKCCRDPNYKDPWPSANLVNGVDDGQYKEDNLYGQHQGILATNRLVRSSNGTRTNVRRNAERPQNSQETCGERHKNSKPSGPGPLDANFAEYPWQAMILRDSNRSLLCGGAIIRRNAVLTAAHCVEGLDTSDVLIKGGEWKLGIDEEPLPFQIVKVGAILRHPEYVPGSYKNDLAILVLREKLRPSKNVGTICLPDSKQAPTANCIATGWGKRILQLHAKGAIMHHINVDVIDGQKCQQTLQQNFQSLVENYGPSTICGVSEIDHCKVDYGSALACPNSQGQYTLTGIYAWDTGCKEESQIGGYIAPDVEWIESSLAKSIKELKKIEREYLLKTSA